MLKLLMNFRLDSGAPVMDENVQPQLHVRCSDVNAVCEARKLVSFK